MSIKSVMPSNHFIFCHLLLLMLSIFLSIRFFSNGSVLCIRYQKYWTFRFSISPSNEYSGLISFRMDWLDLLAVQGTLKSLLQHHNSKASILWCSAFFLVQLSHQYMTIGKPIALTRWTFVGKVMSLIFNMLSRLVITFLPRSKCLLISWLQAPPAVILEPNKIKSSTVSVFSLSVSYRFNYAHVVFPGGSSGEEPACQRSLDVRDSRSTPGGKVPWRRAWQPTPVFSHGESHGQRSLVGCGS